MNCYPPVHQVQSQVRIVGVNALLPREGAGRA